MFHRKVPLRDANGDIVKWYGSSLDIEERRTAEEQLRRNTEELRRSEFYRAEGQRLAHMGSWVFELQTFSITGRANFFRYTVLIRPMQRPRLRNTWRAFIRRTDTTWNH
jgi:hypothetical protein